MFDNIAFGLRLAKLPKRQAQERVLDKGRIQQLGTPHEVYHRPASPFTARFVGDANVLGADVMRDDGGRPQAEIAGVRMPMVDNGAPVGRAWLVVRREDLLMPQLLKAEVATTLGSPLAVGSRVSVDWDARAALVLPRDA